MNIVDYFMLLCIYFDGNENKLNLNLKSEGERAKGESEQWGEQ